MADSSVGVTAGSGTSIDTRTEATNGNHRAVVVIGDPSTNAGVAPVDATKGLAVDLTATGQNTTALKVDGSAVTQPVSMATNQPVGTVAHDGVDSGNPVKVGAKAITALSGTTLVASADRTDAQSDLDGSLIVRNGYCLGDVVNGKNTSTGTTVVSVISAPGASTYLYITDIILANTGSTTSLVTIQYDTAGTPTDLAYCINPTAGGSNMHFDPPLKVPTANKDVGFKPGSASTTQYCTIIGFKSKL